MDKTEYSLAVGIPTYRRRNWLLEVIRCLGKQVIRPDKIIVVDQSETPIGVGTLQAVLNTNQCNILVISQPVPHLPQARNRIFQESKCDITLFVDDDVTFKGDFIQQHMKLYVDSQTHAVGGQVFQKPGLAAGNLLELYSISPRGHRYYLFRYPDGSKISKFYGCNFSVRTKTALSIGGIDEAFFGPNFFFEETDFVARLTKVGYGVRFSETASVCHFKAATGGCRMKSPGYIVKQSSIMANYFIMFLRHQTLLILPAKPKISGKLKTVFMEFFLLLKRGFYTETSSFDWLRVIPNSFALIGGLSKALYPVYKGPRSLLRNI